MGFRMLKPGEFAKLHPNHPFAGTSIIFGGRPTDSSTSESTPSSKTEPVDRRQRLMDSKPKREAFRTEEEFEEALGYWNSHQGRILSMTAPSKGAPKPSK